MRSRRTQLQRHSSTRRSRRGEIASIRPGLGYAGSSTQPGCVGWIVPDRLRLTGQSEQNPTLPDLACEKGLTGSAIDAICLGHAACVSEGGLVGKWRWQRLRPTHRIRRVGPFRHSQSRTGPPRNQACRCSTSVPAWAGVSIRHPGRSPPRRWAVVDLLPGMRPHRLAHACNSDRRRWWRLCAARSGDARNGSLDRERSQASQVQELRRARCRVDRAAQSLSVRSHPYPGIGLIGG